MADLAQATAISLPNRFPSTTFDSLLQGLKSLLKREVGQRPSFNEYNTFRIGAIPPDFAYPALAVRPVNLSIGPFSSGGQYQARYDTIFEIWVRHDRADYASSQANRLYDDLEIFLNEHPTVDGRCHHIEFGEVQKDEAIPDVQRLFVQGFFIPVAFFSKQTRPAVRRETRIEFTEHPTLPEVLFEVLKSELRTTKNNINFFRAAAFPPSPVYPAVTLVETTKDRDRSRSGVDQDVRTFAITVSNKVTPHEDSIRQNLSVTDDVISTLFQNRNLQGFARNSQPANVAYAIAQLGGEESPFLYASEIEFAVWANRVTPSYT